jgi:hypothetical protein
MLASLRHPNICLYMAACIEPPNRAIVTELVSRGSLWEVLRTPNLFEVYIVFHISAVYFIPVCHTIHCTSLSLRLHNTLSSIPIPQLISLSLLHRLCNRATPRWRSTRQQAVSHSGPLGWCEECWTTRCADWCTYTPTILQLYIEVRWCRGRDSGDEIGTGEGIDCYREGRISMQYERQYN